jgi:hypothetical protein
MEPTDRPFAITIERLPHGFIEVTDQQRAWFQRMINSDIRYYYRMIRNNRIIPTDNPIGRSGVTAGELAVYITRENHCKRQRRY